MFDFADLLCLKKVKVKLLNFLVEEKNGENTSTESEKKRYKMQIGIKRGNENHAKKLSMP